MDRRRARRRQGARGRQALKRSRRMRARARSSSPTSLDGFNLTVRRDRFDDDVSRSNARTSCTGPDSPARVCRRAITRLFDYSPSVDASVRQSRVLGGRFRSRHRRSTARIRRRRAERNETIRAPWPISSVAAASRDDDDDDNDGHRRTSSPSTTPCSPSTPRLVASCTPPTATPVRSPFPPPASSARVSRGLDCRAVALARAPWTTARSRAHRSSIDDIFLSPKRRPSRPPPSSSPSRAPQVSSLAIAIASSRSRASVDGKEGIILTGVNVIDYGNCPRRDVMGDDI